MTMQIFLVKMASTEQLLAYEKQLDDFKNELLKAQENLEKKESQVAQYANQMYSGNGKQNLVEWELDFKPELEDIGHMLRCDVVKINSDGQYWETNPDESKIILNEIGVNDILRKVIILVNKNKVLSNYTIEEVNQRVEMIGHELRSAIYNNYEHYGIDNEYKMINYPSLVMDILDVIDSAYRRALQGETHKGLNEQRLVTQSDNLNLNNQQIQQPQKQVKFYNPATWF